VKILLDTCAFLWFLDDAAQLPPQIRGRILDPENQIFLSAVSVWEIARKYAGGNLTLPAHPSSLIPAVREQSGIEPLPLTEADALAAEKLPHAHRDPFDRMLIAQALNNGLIIATSDRAFDLYPVRVIW
jgi:PIN domain nuclease of toxin-antitoxin system